MSDSDSDYCDLGEEVEVGVGEDATTDAPRVNKNGVKVRGPDKCWVETHRFANAPDFKASDIAKQLETEFSNRKSRENEYADVFEFECKYKRRVGFLPCPMKIKVAYLSHNSEVTVESIEGVADHIHEEDSDFVKNPSQNFRWPAEASKIVTEGVVNHAKPNVIKRNLKNANVFGREVPTKTQLYNKIAATKMLVFPSTKVKNTNELRQKVAEYLAEPASEIEAYVAFHEIDDEDESKAPRFTIIFTSRRNMAKMKNDRVLQTDATYRLNWLGFPVFVVGTSTPTGRFFATCAVLSSHEDSASWAKIYQFIHDAGIKPTFQLGDGAKAITKAGNEVFTGFSFSRLMCWAHVHSNMLPQLKCISAQNRSVSDNILKDIVDIQWSALNERSFRKSFNLLEKKYISKFDTVLNGVIDKFFSYMHKVWIDSSECMWYEGAHPWEISNNQGVEGKNKEIKLNHTFRRRLEIGELVAVLQRLVSEWSEEDDRLLVSSRLAGLHGEANSLSLRTDGYQCYKANKSRTDKIIRINPKDKYTISESSEFLLGKVSNLWAVCSTAGSKTGLSLKERAKERIANREVPVSGSFDDYMRIRSSCWILEERDGDFFCDCPVGMKGKLCKHTVGLLYKTGVLEAAPDVRSVPLGAKRKPGRPKKIPNCLEKSPVRPIAPTEEVDLEVHTEAAFAVKKTTRKRKRCEKDDQLQVQEIQQQQLVPGNEQQQVLEVQLSPVAALVSQARSLKPGLGTSKPPKKSRKLQEPGTSKVRVEKPPTLFCKKKKHSCNHEVVFGEHYNQKAWKKYAEYVRSQKSSVDIDPSYIP